MNDSNLMFQLVSVALGAVTTVLLYKTFRLNAQLDKAVRQNDKMREYGRNSTTLTYEYVDAVLLGPRYSGKSSLAQLWSAPWTNVHDIVPSPNWTIEEFSLHEFEPQRRYDDTFDLERQFEPVLRIRVRDYPGEDAYRIPAIRDIKALGHRVVLVFVMRVGFVGDKFSEAAANASYFSKAFLDELESVLGRIGGSVSRVLVVFSKSDLAPTAMDDKTLVALIRKENKTTIDRLEATFGGVMDFLSVSAITNQNVVKLLGMIASTAIQASGEEEKLDLALKAIEARIRRT